MRKIAILVAAMLLGLTMNAIAKQPFHQSTHIMEGQFVSLSGCIQYYASFPTRQSVVVAAREVVATQSILQAGVTQYDTCIDTFPITAGELLSLDDFSLDRSLDSARVRAHGAVTNTQNGREAQIVIDVSFVSTTHPLPTEYTYAQVECRTADGQPVPCERTQLTGNGIIAGTFTADGSQYATPPSEPLPGIFSASAYVSRLQANCVLPDGEAPEACQLIEFQ